MAIITTSSIKDGDVRADGLEQLLARGGTITFAVRSIPWPGRANVQVSLLSVTKAPWLGKRFLDGKQVDAISSRLDDTLDAMSPIPLNANGNRIAQGTIFLGEGFVLSPTDTSRFVKDDPRCIEAIRPLIKGQELNNAPAQEPGSMIIDFGTRGIDHAQRFPLLLERVERLVKPQRSKDGDPGAWWQHWRSRPELYATIRPLPRCFASAVVTKYLSFSAAPTNIIFTHKVYVLMTDQWDQFAAVQSSVHEAWARKYTGSLGQGINYAPTDCFVNFAFPSPTSASVNNALADIGSRYHEHRRQLMLSLWLGLTDVYNLFHSRELDADLAKHFAKRAKKDPQGLSIPEEHRSGAVAFTPDAARAGIVELRRLHVELDTAVRDAYGWQDLPLEHDFYEVETLPENDRVRYTISPAARKELLRRLLELNHKRAAEEAAAMPVKKGKGRGKELDSASSHHITLFDDHS
jgi:hypothetical protein